MEKNKIINELQIDDIYLRKVKNNDVGFINKMFKNSDIKKYYVLDWNSNNYSGLIKYWIGKSDNNEGFTWIITQKTKSIFKKEEKCGFIAFVIEKKFNTARLSFALDPKYRGKGIMTKAINCVLENIIKIGIEIVEADINTSNKPSEKIIKKLGFEDTKIGMYDPNRGIFEKENFRKLWVKKIFDKKSLDFFIIQPESFSDFFKGTVYKLGDEEINQLYLRTKTGRFFLVLVTDVTEKLVGISDNNEDIYKIYWELIYSKNIQGRDLFVLKGWGDEITGGGNFQFENHKIALDKYAFFFAINNLLKQNYPLFNEANFKKTIGFENCVFENGFLKI